MVFVAAFLRLAVWESFRPKSSLAWPAERRCGSPAVLCADIVVAVRLRLNSSTLNRPTTRFPSGARSKLKVFAQLLVRPNAGLLSYELIRHRRVTSHHPPPELPASHIIGFRRAHCRLVNPYRYRFEPSGTSVLAIGSCRRWPPVVFLHDSTRIPDRVPHPKDDARRCDSPA